MISKNGYMKFLRKKMAEGGEVGGDPGYGQPYNRKNSSGEPHTNEYFEDEHPMEYMADGGEVADKEKKPAPSDLGAQISANMRKAVHNINSQGQQLAKGGMIWDEQRGEPSPSNAHNSELDPDLSHEDAMDEEMANFAEGGMAYHDQGHVGEEEDDEVMPDMSHEDAMDDEMADLKKKRQLAHGGMAHFAHALRKGMR